MTKFSVTFEKYTPESVEYGDAAERGFVARGITLREALDHFEPGCVVEANSYPIACPRWFTFYQHEQDPLTGNYENRSLHLPEAITPASAMRIARLIKCYGASS